MCWLTEIFMGCKLTYSIYLHLKILTMWMRSSNMPSRPEILQIIMLENLVCLNDMRKRLHQSQILIQVLVPQEIFLQVWRLEYVHKFSLQTKGAPFV